MQIGSISFWYVKLWPKQGLFHLVKKQEPFREAISNMELMHTSVHSKYSTLEKQEWNKTKNKNKKVRWEEWVWKVKHAQKKEVIMAQL